VPRQAAQAQSVSPLVSPVCCSSPYDVLSCSDSAETMLSFNDNCSHLRFIGSGVALIAIVAVVALVVARRRRAAQAKAEDEEIVQEMSYSLFHSKASSSKQTSLKDITNPPPQGMYQCLGFSSVA
jgi:hypothetical protein